MDLPVRKNLLPPYLDNDTWQQLLDSADEVLNEAIDKPTVLLAKQRDAWLLNDTGELRADSGQLLDSSCFESPEKALLVRQANMLGFDFKESDLLTDDDYQRIVRNISLFWYGKGKPNFISFMGFVLNSIVEVTRLWSTQGPTYDSYGPLLDEGDPGIGTAVWDGGTWFPTTHVAVKFDPFRFASVQISKLVALFYSIANYNLVLERIILDGPAAVHTVDEATLVRAVCVTPLIDVEEIILCDVGIGDQYMYPNYVVTGYVQ
jgi:hypothetical protein